MNCFLPSHEKNFCNKRYNGKLTTTKIPINKSSFQCLINGYIEARSNRLLTPLFINRASIEMNTTPKTVKKSIDLNLLNGLQILNRLNNPEKVINTMAQVLYS